MGRRENRSYFRILSVDTEYNTGRRVFDGGLVAASVQKCHVIRMVHTQCVDRKSHGKRATYRNLSVTLYVF